jgi:hypothetical protein
MGTTVLLILKTSAPQRLTTASVFVERGKSFREEFRATTRVRNTIFWGTFHSFKNRGFHAFFPTVLDLKKT